ncbi:MAG: Dabb family protein [Pirellulales bacterium]|nr:Dabb family protein [Pirellulales bacterium]
MLCHNVFFSLKNDSPEGRDQLVAACKKYLVKHPGVTYFAVGTPCDLSRPVNDRNFSVAIHIVFADRAAHDAYQTAPDHLKFIEENRETWAQVRVFDTDVDVMPVK